MATTVRKNNNTFAIVVTVAVIAVIAVITALVIWMNNSAGPEVGPGGTPQNSRIDTETGAISVGDGPNTLDTYVDFICPACKAFEQTYGSAIEQQVDAGTLTLNIHPIAILDSRSADEYSSRAAGAMYCVADTEPEAALPFLQAMYQNQPSEGGAGLSDEQIAQIAVGAGVTDTETVESCIAEGTFKRFAQSKTQATPIQPGNQGIATPTIVLNGEVIVNETLTGDPQADIVDKLQ